MKESTKNMIRAAALIACMIPYRKKQEEKCSIYQSLLFAYTWDKDATPPLKIQRN